MTTSSDRLAQLRELAVASHVMPAADLDELVERGIAHAQQAAGGAPGVAQLDVRLGGAPVRGHDVSVRILTGILGPLQESITAVGQALRQKTTGRGRVSTAILRGTELSMSPQLSAGSIVFHLAGPAETATGEEMPEATGTESLVDAALRALFAVLAESRGDDLTTGALASALRPLGPRTAKHLSDLAREVVDDDVEIDLTWRLGTAAHKVGIDRRSALALHDAIERNRTEIADVTITGRLLTVSTVRKAEIDTGEGPTIKLTVDAELARSLADFYDREVTVIAQLTTTWSLNTGVESRSYALQSIELAGADVGDQSKEAAR